MTGQERYLRHERYNMIHPFFEDDAWFYWVVSVGALLSFLGLIVACICSCRRNENKNEFLGLAGMVTLNHSENDGFNRLPTLDVSQLVSQDSTDSGKRTTTANRSLPDIPKDKNPGTEERNEQEPQDIYEATEIIGDQSELYATVQDTPEEQNPERDVQESLQQNSVSQEGSTYPYARVASPNSSNDEHPYAQVQNIQKTEANQQNRNTSNQVTTADQPSTSTNQPSGNPVAPPRTRRSSSHNSLLSSDAPGDIQAANAISGGVQANQDLPYMTPPLLMLLPHPTQPQHSSPQQHFSGDSQDSKGYTSISVREPLANIIAQTKSAYQQNQPTRLLTDSHYATVSDDSDEMYAAIDEQDKVYTSGSETYAQIQPMSTELHRIMQCEQNAFCQSIRTEEVHSAPQPPSVDSLRHVAHAHSRQASSSSANSSIINPGSPKPEKRQANSPLPPPPEANAEVYASVDKRTKNEDRSRASLATGKSLEDMYAKVMKKKKDTDEQPDVHASSTASTLQPEATGAPSCRKLSLIEVSRASWSSHDSVEIQKKEPEYAHYATPAGTAVIFRAESETAANATASSRGEADASSLEPEVDHGYEAVATSAKRAVAARSMPASLDPNYETLRPQCSRDADYQSAVAARNGTEPPSGYSVPFKHRQVSNASSEDPGYERVRLRRRVELDQDTDSEPNYESMPHDPGEPNYASVCRPGDSDTDPNYESVSHGDPNYESVKYMSVALGEEPPYEQVNNYASRANADGYEKVKGSDARESDYEKISLNHPLERVSNGDTDDEQYVQV